MVLTHIFLDLDDVLADFVGEMCREFNVKYAAATSWELHNACGVTKFEWFRWLKTREARFWERLKVQPWANPLVQYCKRIAPTSIATARNSSRAACASVGPWIVNHLGALPWAILDDKHLLAQPGRALIDDNEHKVERFREAGGVGILFPRPWNSASQDTHRALEAVVRQLMEMT